VSCRTDKESKEVDCYIKNWLSVIFIYKILQKGDIITAKTIRNVFVWKNGKKVKVGRKEGIVDLKIEKITLDSMKKAIRVKGVIVDGPEDFERGYHSIDVRIGDRIKIKKKEWSNRIEKLSRLFSERNITTNYSEYLSKFFEHFNKDDGLVAYGNDVKEVVAYGIVKFLIVPDDVLFDESIIELVSEALSKGSKIVLVDVNSEEGRKFKKNFGLAALLRFSYKTSYISS